MLHDLCFSESYDYGRKMLVCLQESSINEPGLLHERFTVLLRKFLVMKPPRNAWLKKNSFHYVDHSNGMCIVSMIFAYVVLRLRGRSLVI